MAAKTVMQAMSDEELSREVASQTRLIRHGWSSHDLQSSMDECRRRGKMEIFHSAQEREFSRPINRLILIPNY